MNMDSIFEEKQLQTYLDVYFIIQLRGLEEELAESESLLPVKSKIPIKL
jgi:hypothetical protein